MVSIGDLVKLLDLGEKLKNYLAGLTDRSLRKKGIIDFHEERDNLTPDWWTDYFCKRKRPNKVIIMGQSLEKTFKNRMQADIFVNWCNSGLQELRYLSFLRKAQRPHKFRQLVKTLVTKIIMILIVF